MHTTTQVTRKCVAVCSFILAATSVAKMYSLMRGSGLLLRPHSFLPGNFALYVWLGLAVELIAFVVLWAAGSRAFLTYCLGLAILFIGYHGLEAGLQIEAPCPCLGGFLSRWKPLAQSESVLSFLLASGLAVASFIGLFPVSASNEAASSRAVVKGSAFLAMATWLLCGLSVVWLWSGRELAGDEGMEVAKSLQFLLHPQNVGKMWNDQPPFFSMFGAMVFQVFGPSMNASRMAIVILGLLMPLVWSIYSCQLDRKWAGPIAVLLLWFAVPDYFAAFMLEAPAYSVGTAALLPLLICKQSRLTLLISAFIASLALLIKLTAAFALVVPFMWLLQRNWRYALGWGVGAVGLTFCASLVLPGWSWADMRASHLNFANDQIWQYHLEGRTYAEAWFICLLAIFSVASRYVKGQLGPIVPWISAALAAILVHLLHRPFWHYYNVHLIAPLAVLAGVGLLDLWRSLERASVSNLERTTLTGVASIVCLLWFWQRETQIADIQRGSIIISKSPIVAKLRSLGESGHSAFSMSPLWTFTAGQVQTPPELTVLPLKRFWSGQISDAAIANMLASNRVDAIVLGQDALKEPAWTNLLSGYLPTAREGPAILFERRELNPKPIDLRLESQLKVQLGRLGL
jgi:hypothetical protein